MSAAAKPFPSYLELPARVPDAAWRVLRALVLLASLGMAWILASYPTFGLALFWRVVVPLLPAIFAFAPGLWRQVCPMAYLNQLPRSFGLAGTRTLPVAWKNHVYIFSVILFFVLVSLRRVYLNTVPDTLILLILLALGFSLFGGLLFKGRSGWCGTFCPLAPIQRAYGQAPLVVVRNGYCPTCVGCQKNCYDFNPKAAVHSDLADSDPWYAGHKKFFAAAMPGVMIGYFLAVDPSKAGIVPYFLEFAGAMALSMGIFMTLTSLLRVSAYRATAVFAMVALNLYYLYMSPTFVATVSSMTGVALPASLAWLIDAVILALTFVVLYNGFRSETAFAQISAPAANAPRVDTAVIRAAAASAAADLVVERSSGRSFAAVPGRSILEGIESAGLTIDFGCRMGMCGADPVAIVEGMDHLSEPTSDELATLRRLDLVGRARMACVCKTQRGGVTIDIKMNPRDLPAPIVAAPAVDRAIEAGIKRVVIIGNGAAGTSAADEIRRASPSCHIDLIARENHAFYNRMALGRVLYGRTAMDGLDLMAADWGKTKNISVWLNTVATSIDPAKREVTIGTGEVLTYDRLVMAQGARAMMPPAEGVELPGCFVLREAADAMAMRRWRQEKVCRHAVVVGGGVLGVEAADALRHLNLDVTILQRADRLMNTQLDQRGSDILTRFLENLGIKVRTDISVKRVRGSDRVQSVELSDGEVIPCDLYLACAGVAPNTELAKAAGLKVNRGVVVDRGMRTSDPHIFAIGDVAELPGEISGLWAVSTAHATVVAASIFGGEAAYVAPSTLVTLKSDGIDVKGFGLTEAKTEQQETIEGDAVDEHTHRKLIVEGGRIAGAVFVGPPGIGKHIGPVIQKKADLTPILEDLRQGRWEKLETLA